ncbi:MULTISPECIES: hypothetical protein [unclassified Chryseobacterium]|uniref:hypothetical protein n=1 Tax=unclassified Chryseobacterium TaxID=2593645 RepID=UPI001E5785CC|nr:MULTISPECIES: hypothetical protein [unclassified Chryseobacterium]
MLSPKSTLYLKGMYGTLSDDETHYKHRVRFDKFSAANNTARVELQNIHNLLITELTSVSLGGNHQFNKSKIFGRRSRRSHFLRFLRRIKVANT